MSRYNPDIHHRRSIRFIPYGRVEVPSVLRNPETARRIERLIDLARDWRRERAVTDSAISDGADQILRGVEAPKGRPRRRLSGLWY